MGARCPWGSGPGSHSGQTPRQPSAPATQDETALVLQPAQVYLEVIAAVASDSAACASGCGFLQEPPLFPRLPTSLHTGRAPEPFVETGRRWTIKKRLLLKFLGRRSMLTGSCSIWSQLCEMQAAKMWKTVDMQWPCGGQCWCDCALQRNYLKWYLTQAWAIMNSKSGEAAQKI